MLWPWCKTFPIQSEMTFGATILRIILKRTIAPKFLTGASQRPPIPASTYLSFTEMTRVVTGLPFPIASLTCLTLEQKGSEGSHIFSQSICRTSFHGRNLKSLPPWKERLDEEHLVLILLGGGVLKCADELLIEKRWSKWEKKKKS